MFYKLTNNGIVVDLLREVRYVRYLPRSKRWMGTEATSAHGVLGSDNNTIYHIEGRVCPCETSHPRVIVEKISEQEYQKFANEIILRKRENAILEDRITSLEDTLTKQTQLIELLLQKLEK